MEKVYKTYRPAWRGYYPDFLLMLLVFIAAGAVQYFKSGAGWLKWVWIAAVVIDVILFIYTALKRATEKLELRDDPQDPANQEIAHITCNPLKPMSRDFRKSIEIGLTEIVHIEVEQTAMQTILGIGYLVITSSGTGGQEISAKNILHPAEVRDEIQVHIDKYRNK